MYQYSYEYGWIKGDETVDVYRSKDGLIGLRVYNHCGKGVCLEGYSRFFLWDEEGIGAEFESELQARAFVGVSDNVAGVGSMRLPPGETNLA